MGFFAKKKVVDYETDESIPEFTIDPNGFIMFEDADLGGAAVLEIVPHVMTESITHEDPLHNNMSTDDDDYMPSVGSVFGDRRRQVYQPWVHFLNSLQSSDMSNDPIHIQILVKKCMADEWVTRLDYASYTTEQEAKDILHPKHKPGDAKPTMKELQKEALMRERARDYLDLLDFMKYDMESAAILDTFDVRTLPTYKTKFFLVISYTPTSEGWWMDGRDSDYYVADNISATSMFRSDKFVEGFVDRIVRRRNKKNPIDESANDEELFWIASDRTAQVLDTRVRKLEKVVLNWNKEHNRMPMPFTMRRLHPREAAALIRFFPNILTPYWDKIWNLKTNENDVLRAIERDIAIATGNADRINRNTDDIISGKIKIRYSDEEREAVLAQYRNKSIEELQDISGDYDDRFWTAQREEERAEAERLRREHQKETDALWSGIDNVKVIAEEDKTDAQRREEFLEKYKNRTPTMEYTKFNEEIIEERKRKEQRKKLRQLAEKDDYLD